MEANLNHWSVTVAVDGDDVLTISHDHLAGKDGLDDLAPAIRTAAAHLLCFIGPGKDIVGGNVALAHSDAVQAPLTDGQRSSVELALKALMSAVSVYDVEMADKARAGLRAILAAPVAAAAAAPTTREGSDE